MNKVNFAIREIWELYSLEFLISEFKKYWIKWNIYVTPFNSDLELFNVSKFLSKHKDINIIDWSKWIHEKCIWFRTDISWKFENQVQSCIDVYKLATCTDMTMDTDLNQIETFDIVVSNVKINDKKTEKEYNPKMWGMLWKLPYKIAVVPRHPIPNNFLNWVNIPNNITIINKVWVLRWLCAKTSLTVMWLIFSNPKWEMDHSPLEVTINSNTISWIYQKTEEAYKDFYNNSWLIHQYRDFHDSIEDIPNLINDEKLDEKLANKRKWIKNNRDIYLPKVLDILLNN